MTERNRQILPFHYMIELPVKIVNLRKAQRKGLYFVKTESNRLTTTGVAEATPVSSYKMIVFPSIKRF